MLRRSQMWWVAALVALTMILGCTNLSQPDDDYTYSQSPEPYRSYAPEDEPVPGSVHLWGDGVLRAQIDAATGTIDAASFLVRWKTGEDAALITAHRVFGPANGLSRQYPAVELPQLVRGVRARTIKGVEVVRSGSFLPLPQARTATPDDASADLAVWRVPDEAQVDYRYQLGLASQPPIRGERVFVAINVPGSSRILHNAVVEEVTPQVLRYQVHGRIDLRGAAGAPVLNVFGSVVGMHVAATERDGALHGDANPAAAILGALQRSW